MRIFTAFLTLLNALLLVVAATDDGLTTEVTWDEYSLTVNGERILIMAGEFHYQRLPVPELWLDVLQKFKANGLNAISVYFFWSYHSPSPDVFDFTSPAKDVQRLLDMAKETGLYVIARPGPYCNAETNAGGLALWTTDGSGGDLRTSDETYHQAWLPWVNAIGAILETNQITNGGPIILLQIENELQETTHSANNTLVVYMEQIETAFRHVGIVVPFTSNEKGMRSQSWSTDYEDVGGAVNVYGLDSYPGGLSCTNPSSGFNAVRTYYQWFQNNSYTQPEFLPEFESGYFQPWGGYFYDSCEAEHSPAFADVYYKGNIGQRVTLMSLYMAFGGTNWGQSAAPVVYTSYDYSAPLRETRQVQDKFKQTKLLALFTRVSQDLRKTVMTSNGTDGVVSNTTPIWTWVLRNIDSGAGFYFTSQNVSSSQATVEFSMDVVFNEGDVTIPNMQLQGRQSRIVVTDYSFGNETLVYSSAQVLTYGLFDAPVLVFYLNVGQVGEFALKSSPGTFTSYGNSSSFEALNTTGEPYKAAYRYTQGEGTSVIKFSNGLVVYLLDTETAYTFFAPSTSTNPNVSPEDQIFILGPYNVRNASLTSTALYLTGDNTNTTTISIHTHNATSITTIVWNNIPLTPTLTPYSALLVTIPGTESTSNTTFLPTLSTWRTANSLPETSPTYNDSAWTICNKTTTLSPVSPLTLPVLFSSDYGFYTGIKIYRGYFSGLDAVAANITVQGGVAFGWNAWVNGVLVGGSPGNASVGVSWALLEFDGVELTESGNVVTVVTDYTGHDETSTGPAGAENPRGILGAQLFGPDNQTVEFDRWMIQGNAGGGKGYVDPVRGPMNEGGLLGERLGWHLPGFDTEGWEQGSPMEGLEGAGVSWYVTSFELDIPDDLDVPVGVELGVEEGTVARVMLFVNGYQYGKYVPHIGPQTRFPIPPGIINNRGNNTLAISLWAQTDAGAKLADVSLIEYGRYQTGFDFLGIGEGLQPGWSEKRLEYA
ncbi:glycoside hydrolase family 35 protein [Saccharata proteae CBS 121410]|uniref:beta-galactosidase n=1 Tax=Saccharata proteae CBS 121410 TaxID=1314787 RepID=A0A9P4HTX4_9PEZI|nr:glycoside hydrolase family 35 protein [Saccharata proteae CBS 121410]